MREIRLIVTKNEIDQTGGTSGYRGYEYQILVSVWLGLKLMLELRSCDAVEIEPASDEDIEAKLNVGTDAANTLLGFTAGEVQLDVQVKSRESGQWTESDFAKVLKGPKPRSGNPSIKEAAARKRLRPLERLRAEADRRYLFVTNAQLHSKLRDFEVSTIGAESAACALPAEKRKSEDSTVAPRIGVIPQLTIGHLRLQIENVLGHHGHVPPSRVAACVADLQNAVRHRLLKEVSGVWTRAELEATLRRFEGLPITPRELVEPSNMAEIRARLAAGRLILTGPAGTGKTFVAEHLEHEHRSAQEPFDIVTSKAGIDRIRRCLGEPGRHFFVFEDPWGHYKLEADADFWRSELPKLFARASQHKRFLVTSRTGVKAQAFGTSDPAVFKDAEVEIRPEHYPPDERKKILAVHLRAAEPWQRELAQRHELEIIKELGEPLALQEFAERLRQEKNETRIKIDDLIRRSSVQVISQTCAEEVIALGPDSVAAGIALWSLLMTRGAVSETTARELQQRLENASYEGDVDTLKLFRWLQNSGRFIPTANDESFAVHPTVMQGLEMLIDREPARGEKVLSALLGAFAADDSGAELETLATYIATRKLPIPAAAQTALNEHLRRQVLELDGSEWQKAFRTLAKFSTATDAVSLLVRALRPTTMEKMGEMEYWKPPNVTEEEKETMRAAPETQEIAAKFIRHLLADNYLFHCEAKELTAFFAQFGWDFAEEFFAIAMEALDDERQLNVELFVEAALLTSEPRYDELTDKALAASDRLDTWYAAFKEEVRQAEQCELNADHASHVEEQPGERFGPVRSALRTAVKVRREREGYASLLTHPRRGDLLWPWAEAVGEATDQELTALREACEPEDLRPFWKAVETAGGSNWKDALADGLEITPEEHLGACLESLASLVSVDEWQGFISQRTRSFPIQRRLALAVATFHGDVDGEKRRLLRAALFESEQLAAVELCLDENSAESVTLPTETSDFLKEIVHQAPDTLAVAALRVLGTPEELARGSLPKLLRSPSFRVRHNALVLAAKAVGFDGRQVLLTALKDEHYRCRRTAMRLLADGANEDDKNRILDMARDKRAPVRETCAGLIGEHRWHEGEPVLARLIRDTRDSTEGSGIFRYRLPNYHVARAAAKSLREMDSLRAETIREIISFIESQPVAYHQYDAPDIGVPYELLLTLGSQTDRDIPVLYARLLQDSRYAEGTKQSGYPLRFAAAWGLVMQLGKTPALRSKFDPAIFVDGACHSDDRLAGPCLFALGILGNRANQQLAAVAASSTFSADRALTVAVSLSKDADAARGHLADVLRSESPQRRFLDWAKENRNAHVKGVEDFLHRNPDVTEWLDSIQASTGIFPELRCALHMRFGAAFGKKLNYADLFERHLPEPLPVLTMRSMFGPE